MNSLRNAAMVLVLGIASLAGREAVAANAEAAMPPPFTSAKDVQPLVFDRSKKSGPQGDTWASIARLPDWTGAWGLDQQSFGQGMQAATGQNRNGPYNAPLTDEWEAKRMSNGAANNGRGPEDGVDNNSATCVPSGMPGIMGAPFAFQFSYGPGMVMIVPESLSLRWIYTDGRGHPADVDKTFNGHSIGYWVGDTLMVDTVAIKEKAEFFMGLKTSGETHVIERIRKVSPTKMRIDFTVTDSKALQRPFNFTRTYELSKRGMIEYYCTENNRDSNDYIDLTPPK